MVEIVDALTKLGITGPTAIFVIAAGYLLMHVVRKQAREVETNITLANALTQLTQAVIANKETLERIEGKLGK